MALMKPDFADIDRLNYPRPQFYRPKFMKLNGAWEFDFDDEDRGLNEKWQAVEHHLGRTINVPFAYQSALSGIDDKGVHPVGWNKRTFSVPKEWNFTDWIDHDLILHFGAVDYKAQVFINGEEAFLNEGGQVPFSFDVTPYLKNGGIDEQITVRAEDSEDADQPRGKQVAHPHDMYYTDTSFIWQDVWIEAVPKTRIQPKGFKITPSAENKAVYFEIPIILSHNVAFVEVQASEADDPENIVVASIRSKIKGSGTRMRLQFQDDVKFWSPEAPNLYNLRIRLIDNDGNIVDEVLSYTGIRDIEVKPEGYYLNGVHKFLLGPLDQGYWPEGNLTPPSGEALRQDVQWLKDCGFNTVRKHQKVEDPRFLYWADKMGVMVWGEMGNAQTATPRGQQRTLREMIRAVERDYNHPCIITWVPENESFSSPGLKDGIKQQFTFQQELIYELHKTDPTRPALPDGWLHNPEADVIGIHDYSATGDQLRKHYADFETGKSLEGNAGTSPFKIMACESLYRQQPIILTEVGGFMYNSPEESGIGYVTISGSDAYLAKYEEIAQAIMDSTPIAGAIFTQAYHVETEKNGFQTYDRKALVPPAALKEINERIFNRDSILRNLKVRKTQMRSAAQVLREKALLRDKLYIASHSLMAVAGISTPDTGHDVMVVADPQTAKEAVKKHVAKHYNRDRKVKKRPVIQKPAAESHSVT